MTWVIVKDQTKLTSDGNSIVVGTGTSHDKR